MKNFFTLTLCVFTLSLTAQEPLTYPYNPDANSDQFVAVSDVLETIAIYGSDYFPSEIMVGDTTLSNWIQILNQTLANQQAVIDSLQASLDSQETQLDSTMIADMIAAAGGASGKFYDSPAYPQGRWSEEYVRIECIGEDQYVVPEGKNLYVIRREQFSTDPNPVYARSFLNGEKIAWMSDIAGLKFNPLDTLSFEGLDSVYFFGFYIPDENWIDFVNVSLNT